MVVVLAGLSAACGTSEEIGTSQNAVAGAFIVSCPGALPSGFSAGAASNGDVVVNAVPAAGFAQVNTATPSDYAVGGCDVLADVSAQWISPETTVEMDTTGNPPNSGNDDFFFDLQWGHDAVNAPEAWDAGVRGSGARVAVLDTGFDLNHPDLAPNINLALSRDFTGEGLAYTLPGPFSHGTHTAGTIAAADNGYGTIGIAPEAELVLVKVLGDGGQGTFGNVLSGVLYASAVDADIISMSLGGLFPRSGDTGPDMMTKIMNRVAMHVRSQGSLVIAAAGNDALDFDHSKDWINMPSDAPGVISISATAPRGWATPEGSALDFRASYSNYGKSAISFSGPGGDFVYPGDELCNVSSVHYPCFVFDLVFSTGAWGSWYWSAGTSMATPHAAGVAALIVSEGGFDTPALLEAEMRARAADLGKKGTDSTHGRGQVMSGY